MNLKTTLILFGVLALAVGVFGLFQIFGVRTAAERESDSKFVFASLNDRNLPVDTKDFARLVVERPNPDNQQPEKIEFTRSGGRWEMTAPLKGRVDETIVSSLATQVKVLPKEKAKLDEGLAAYGLDKPTATITIERDKGKHVLKVGRQGPEAKDPLLYVVSSDQPDQPVAIKKSNLDKLFAPLGDFRDKRIFTSSFGINGLTLAGKDRTKVELAKKSDTQWEFKSPALGEADIAAVNTQSMDLAALRIEKNGDFLHDGAADAELLKKYGLTAEDASYAITVQQPAVGDASKTVSETLLIGKPDPSSKPAVTFEKAAAQAAALASAAGSGLVVLGPAAEALLSAKENTEPDARYAMKVGENTIFRLSGKHLPVLAKSASDFRAKTLLSLDGARLDAINLKSDGELLKLRKATMKTDGSAPAEWLLFTDSRAKVNAQNQQVQKLVDALNRVAARDGSAFLDDEAAQKKWFGTDAVDLGLDKPQAEIQLWLEGLERDKDGRVTDKGEPAFKETAKNKPAATLHIGRRDAKRQVVYVKKELPGQQPTIVALPDPWMVPSVQGMPMDPDANRQSVSLSEVASAGYLAYRDHALPSPKTLDVARMLVERPSSNLELEKKSTPAAPGTGATTSEWTIVKPFAAKAPLADSVVNVLTQLGADKLVTDRPTDRDLDEKFGVGNKPFMKFTLFGTPTADKKATEYVYLVGRPTAADGKHPNHYYARLLVKPVDGPVPESNQFVFLLTQAQAQSLDQELRDGVVFPFEGMHKPQQLTFTWRTPGADKKPHETKLELALADDKKNWFVKSLVVAGKDDKATLNGLDQAKVNWMAGLANELRAQANGPRLNPLVTERFLIHQGTATPEMHLDPARAEAPPPLVIDMKFDGGAERRLIVGDRFEPKPAEFPFLAGRLFFYGLANSLPQAVFLLNQADYQGLLGGPQFFRPAEAGATQ